MVAWTLRNKEMYFNRVWKKRTYSDIGKEFGVTPARVREVVKGLNRQNYWKSKREMSRNGKIFDPDGIKEINETWTPEQQYEEIESSYGKSF